MSLSVFGTLKYQTLTLDPGMRQIIPSISETKPQMLYYSTKF